jgi:hypothetical protein
MSAPRSTGEIKTAPVSRNFGRQRGGRPLGSLAFPVAVALSACSSIHDDRPAVDLRGKDERTYRADLSECQDIAAGTGDKSGDVAKTAAIGTALGAATGAAAGAIGGNAGAGAAAGALAGLVFGGGYEAVTTERTEKRALRNCLYKRGYTVLD